MESDVFLSFESNGYRVIVFPLLAQSSFVLWPSSVAPSNSGFNFDTGYCPSTLQEGHVSGITSYGFDSLLKKVPGTFEKTIGLLQNWQITPA